MMKKFAVRLEGTGCRVRVQLLEQRSSADETWGFVTTRFVEADSALGAESFARELVYDELKGLLLNTPAEPWTLKIDEIWEDSEAFAEYAPGSGFTWYSGDSEEVEDNDEEITDGFHRGYWARLVGFFSRKVIRKSDMEITLWYRKKGPICYEIMLWDRADTIATELLSTGLTWHWNSALNQSPEDNDGLSKFSWKRDLTLLTSETAELLQADFKQRDVDGCGRYIALIGTDSAESRLTSKKLELDFERFLASEGPPIRCVINQCGDCPGAHVFVPHSPVQSVDALLTLWGVSSITETASYWGLNLAKLESIWRSLLRDPSLPPR